MGGMDLRKTRRYVLSLPVTIQCLLQKPSVSRKGKTYDISTSGVYVVVDNNPEPGSVLNLTITLSTEITGGSEVIINCTGKVVRVENRGEVGLEKFGVAVLIESYEMVRNK
jgi:c-di-GMP-binding flagellar brake protein YcgR